LKDAVARFGSPDAARDTWLESPPCGCTEKVKLAELPAIIVCVLAPVDARVKSFVPVCGASTVIRVGDDELALKIPSPE
jgi:hypothetical protein